VSTGCLTLRLTLLGPGRCQTGKRPRQVRRGVRWRSRQAGRAGRSLGGEKSDGGSGRRRRIQRRLRGAHLSAGRGGGTSQPPGCHQGPHLSPGLTRPERRTTRTWSRIVRGWLLDCILRHRRNCVVCNLREDDQVSPGVGGSRWVPASANRGRPAKPSRSSDGAAGRSRLQPSLTTPNDGPGYSSLLTGDEQAGRGPSASHGTTVGVNASGWLPSRISSDS
jgi:hypothetical protein